MYWKSSCLLQAIKEGHDLMQRKKLHCLLNPSTPIRYKNPSSYTEIHVVAIASLLLWRIFINYFNRYYFIKQSTEWNFFEINILKIEICLTIIKNNKSYENKFYLLFAGLKKNLCNKQTQTPPLDCISFSVEKSVKLLR